MRDGLSWWDPQVPRETWSDISPSLRVMFTCHCITCKQQFLHLRLSLLSAMTKRALGTEQIINLLSISNDKGRCEIIPEQVIMAGKCRVAWINVEPCPSQRSGRWRCGRPGQDAPPPPTAAAAASEAAVELSQWVRGVCVRQRASQPARSGPAAATATIAAILPARERHHSPPASLATCNTNDRAR